MVVLSIEQTNPPLMAIDLGRASDLGTSVCIQRFASHRAFRHLPCERT